MLNTGTLFMHCLSLGTGSEWPTAQGLVGGLVDAGKS